jgi:hypothetical protein
MAALTLSRSFEGLGVSPFVDAALDEPFGLSVGLGRVQPDTFQAS